MGGCPRARKPKELHEDKCASASVAKRAAQGQVRVSFGGGHCCDSLSSDGKCARVDRDALRAVVCLVDSDQSIGELKHVIPQRDDNKLRAGGGLLLTAHMQV